MANLNRCFVFSLGIKRVLLVFGVVCLFQCLLVAGQDQDQLQNQVRSRNEAHVLEFDQGTNLDASQNLTEGENDRQARLWSLFRRSSASNPPCVSSSGRQGTCRSRKSCEKGNGVVISNSCGNKGTNVCCLARARCSTNNDRPIRINSTGTHMYPPTTYTAPIQCRYDIPRRTGVCQVRVDFVTFDMAQPSSDPATLGNCVDDALTITGADNIRNFQVCGNNRGQHLYLHYGSSNMISLTTRLGASLTPAVFDIVATFIDCNEDGNRAVSSKTKGGRAGRRFTNNNNNDDDDPDMENMNMANAVMAISTEPAPAGCTQYFTRSSGTVQSFNYAAYTAAAGAAGAGSVGANQAQYQLNNQRYTVCVKSNSGTTEISWQTCNNGAFLVSGFLPLVPSLAPGCPTDYVDIPGGNRGSRFCGSTFPGPVTSVMKPFLLGVNFDDVEFLGPNFELNPMTGCCIFCVCVDTAGDLVSNQLCALPNVCELNDNLKDRTDLNNIGFCLTYTVS